MPNESSNESTKDLSPRDWEALQKKLEEGAELGRQLAANLNYNLTHDIDIDRGLQPEPEPEAQSEPEQPELFATDAEEALLSRLRQYAQYEADKLA
jgi:hypothetical protein